MAVPVRLRSMPEHIQAPNLTDLNGYSSNGHQNRIPEEQQLLQFPKSTCVLWDGTSTGQPSFLHVAQHRKPKIIVSEKVLWLIHRQCTSEGSSSRVLVGSLSVDDDAEGICFHIDGLDTRQGGGSSSSDIELGDVMIPVQVSSSKNQDRIGTVEDYVSAVQMLKQRICGREALELSSLLLVKGWCSFYSNGNTDKTVAHLQFDVVTMATVLKATPVNAVPIVPTALAKNLAGPRNLSNLQGRPKSGFLTMDHTRKLLLVLDSDPKVSSLPIVGIWVSGVPLVQHPFVWTACLRYLHSEQLQDRVCTPPEGFLVVLYSPLHSKPEFYEVCTTSGKTDLQFDLYTGYEITSFYKKSSGPDPSSIEWDLCPVRNGPKRELFDAALGEFESQRYGDQGAAVGPGTAASTADDIMPRSTPAPHRAKAMMVKPMVPEVSMLWNDDSQPAAFQPMPAASANGQYMNSSRSGPFPSSYPSVTSSVPLPLQAASRGNVVTYVNDVIVNSNSNNNCHIRASSEQYNGRPPQPSMAGRHPGQERMYMQNGGPLSAANSAYPGHAPMYSSNQLAFGPQPVSNQHFSAHYNQGYAASHSQGQSSVSVSAVRANTQPHYLPPSVQGSELRQLPPSTHFEKQQPCSVPLSSSYSTQPQHHAPHPSYDNGMPPAPSPYIHGGERPHLVPPSAMHLCRPQRMEPPQQNGQVPQAVPQFQIQKEFGPSRNIPLSLAQGQVVHQRMHFSQPRMNGQAQQQASHGAGLTTGQPGCSYPIASSHIVTSRQGNENEHLNFGRMQGSASQFTAQKSNQFVNQRTNNYHAGVDLALGSYPPKSSVASSVPAMASDTTSANCTVPFHPSVTQLRYETVQQAGHDATQADSTSCSGKSSDDSGLSVTPDCPDPSLKTPTSPKLGPHTVSSLGLAGQVNWEGVPPEVVQLLMQQDAQLKVLQAQIQQLLSQQQQQNASQTSAAGTSPAPMGASPSSLAAGTPRRVETCSTAVNTTLLTPEQPVARPVPTVYASVQTSPQKPVHRDHFGSHSGERDEGRSPYVQRAIHTSGGTGGTSAGQTPSEIRHQGAVQLNSTQRDDRSGVSGLSMGSIPSDVSMQQMHSHGHSSPARLNDSQQQGSLSHSTPSPQSASMCGQAQEDEDSKGQEVSPDSKEYYDQLISNIRLLLNNHSKDTEDSQAPGQELPSVEETYTQLRLMESTISGSPGRMTCPSSGGSTNTTLLPHINYLSMMLEGESDTSVEINAMAMKYLKDEQLTQMARLRQGGVQHFSGGNLLRQVLASSADATSMSNTSRTGNAVNNMSMATKKYLEKYGLLGAGDESLLDTNQTIRLQTDFSIAVTSEPRSDPSLPPSPQKGTPRSPGHNTPAVSPAIRSPVKKEVLHPAFQPSPAIAEEAENSFENRRRVVPDLGASPVLQPPGRHRNNGDLNPYHREPSPEDTPIFPERYRGRAHDLRTSECSTGTEDDRILDIEKLKQMPKLL